MVKPVPAAARSWRRARSSRAFQMVAEAHVTKAHADVSLAAMKRGLGV